MTKKRQGVRGHWGGSTGRDGPELSGFCLCTYKERLALFLFAIDCPGS